MRINADSMVCEENKVFKFKSFAEEIIKLCYSEYI